MVGPPRSLHWRRYILFHPLVCLAESGQAVIHTTTANHEDNKYRQIFRLREVHLLAIFILLYVGVEVTLGGKQFLLEEALNAEQTVQGGLSHTSRGIGEVELRPDMSPPVSSAVSPFRP